MKCTQYAKVGDKTYKINTSFRTAIECNEIAKNNSISDLERALAIIYKLFGERALEDNENYENLLELAKKYLSCKEENNVKEDMDFIKDMDLIEASFMSDFHIDLTTEDMDWWKFNKLMNGLSNSELGNCCVLNNVRNLRNFDASKIKDSKERQKIIEAQRFWALDKKENHLTKEQEESMNKLNEILGI